MLLRKATTTGRVIFFLLILFPLQLLAELKGKVIAISDGDTFTLLTADNKQVKVRLYGIDCPEKNQPFGQRAKQFSSEMIFGKQVSVEDKDQDRYGRTIGMVYVNGKCLNEELLKAGLAWHYTQYDRHNIAWKGLESQAKAKKTGLWYEKDCVAPWNWRKQKRGTKTLKKVS